MIFSYNWLRDYVQKLPKPERLAELLTMHSFEVTEVRKIKNDWILDIDVLPNRAPDCFSHLGVAREISAIANSKFKIPAFTKAQASKQNFISVEVRDKLACPRYTAQVVTDVKVASSPKWLRDRLEVCGLNSINNIVDAVNYVMLETGQPIHAFDGKKLAGNKIIVRFAKKGEKITTLDDQKFSLDSDVLVIADAYDPIAIAGIKGGRFPGISQSTKTVILESANFTPRVIRKGSQKLNLKTEASLRFEHGISPNLTEFAINRAAFLIGGRVIQKLDFYPKKVYPARIKLDLHYLKSLLGVKIPKNEILRILKSLGFGIIGLRGPLLVEVPTWRQDVSIPEDLIEEIGRIYGYEKIPVAFPLAALVPHKRNDEVFWENMVKDILKETGFTEVYNYSFISDDDAREFKLKNLVELENPISEEQKYLQPLLTPNLLKNIQKNQNYFSEIKIFELGKVFMTPRLEERLLTGVMTGSDFYQAKGVIDALLNKLGISNIWYDEYRTASEEAKISWWHPQKCAEIKIDGERVGFLGEVSPQILNDFKINTKLVYFDIYFEKLSKLASEEHEYRPISKFPAAVRDIAILVPREVRVEEVLNKIETAGGSQVRDVDLFDIYEGEELPTDKKNLAFRIIYQSDRKTLTSNEVEKIHQKIVKTLEKDPLWQVRK